ncbi:MAG: hypothetical protein ABIF28_04310 [Pseudomonadota bacterium]
MIIYHYSPQTGRLVSIGEADPDPLLEGAWLLPAHATVDEPPTASEGLSAEFIDGAWVLVEDPEPGLDPAPEPETALQTQRRLTAAIQAHLDAQARAMFYDNIFTAVTYAEEPIVPKFQIEGAALRAWRSLVWDYGSGVLAAVLAEERAVPTEQDLIAELPVFVSPSV